MGTKRENERLKGGFETEHWVRDDKIRNRRGKEKRGWEKRGRRQGSMRYIWLNLPSHK